ncbi:MAG: hypothetical protein K9K67_11395 [Bacteriovoracaceae bacterium]|nr:hypothetical protein [Bacteriovoracaceae bacterium]
MTYSHHDYLNQIFLDSLPPNQGSIHEIINYSFIVKPYGWGTIDCSPLSKLIINGEKNCDINIL